MTLERELLVSLLKLTRLGPIQKRLVNKDAHIPALTAEELLEKLALEGLITQHKNLVEASPSQRAKIAVHAAELGADFERVCKLLEWAEFESIACEAFRVNNFGVKRRFRFRQARRMWEIDILGRRQPLVVCVDCKHWHHGWQRAAIMKAAEAQIERTKAFADALPSLYKKAELENWRQATLIPMILSLTPAPLKFHQNVPTVPVLQLQDFLNELPAHAHSLTHFTKKCFKNTLNLTDFIQ